MPRPVVGNLPQLVVKKPPIQNTAKSQKHEISKILNEVTGTNLGAISLLTMEKRKMKPLFKGFNPEQITPRELSKAGMRLFNGGLIDNHTAELLSRAGDEFDKKGEVVNPDKEINALEFFAERIAEMKSKALMGDPYSQILLPDYVKAIHVLQNLYTFASTGESMEMRKLREAEKDSRPPLIRE
ncbi:hypothetical protein K5D34_19615 [Pseudomonas cichorii]|uniref:hypothetical protein n=1 Tax=Pseudomonas cichorii TaxID=36746 RepID=UPI001910BCDA|nr:hypothetical protein [Pseudomonas cichorii]MBX8511894.1 hypothetical protein [Pseudomonas cichorii]MBX8521944.1 hypothetical protein [Pseudomonas cichorii]MBX8526644.1 hypothetical protein [Pseudomonas cichorii]MBX8536818.1 hypothetical protein [Pseudomonas cichorii]MBX8541746.1 hypothetical protein [Pseudomonas cichorii]